MEKGKVYLIGAGPGDPGLITVNGINALKEADVVLYDKLANPELLGECRSDAEMIFVGKAAGHHYVKQEDTIKLMIEKANSGNIVARLKGGDPLIFGRGSEEAVELVSEGIKFEFIPGVTAAAGATAYAGIPLTHRNMATQCVMLTAHEAPGKEESQIEWERLAGMKNTTIVIYMGAAMLPEISKTLIDFGMDENHPAAVVQNGTLPEQRSISGTIKTIPQLVSEKGLKPPLITILGPTVSLREKINFFENKPLFGRRIVVTRAKDQAASFYKMLRELGAEPVPFPVIKTEQANPKTNLETVLENKYEWTVFSSENGVRWFFSLLNDNGKDARVLGNSRVAAIGSGTQKKLKEMGIIADFVPETYTSRALVDELASKYDLAGRNVLRVKGYFEQDPLTENLVKKGAEVHPLEVYRLEKDEPTDMQKDNLMNNGAEAIVFTSGSTVDNMLSVLGERSAEVLMNTIPIAIGPVTATKLEERGILHYIMADQHDLDGIILKLLELF